MLKRTIVLTLTAVSLAGRGTMPQERAISGAGIGAGAGAVLGAITGLGVLEAAAIGAASGAITGVVTDSDQINFGKPAWKQGVTEKASVTSHSMAAKPAVRSNTVAKIQAGLARLGYQPGPVDGLLGERTRAAIRSYQRDKGLLEDGQATPELAQHINGGKS